METKAVPSQSREVPTADAPVVERMSGIDKRFWLMDPNSGLSRRYLNKLGLTGSQLKDYFDLLEHDLEHDPDSAYVSVILFRMRFERAKMYDSFIVDRLNRAKEDDRLTNFKVSDFVSPKNQEARAKLDQAVVRMAGTINPPGGYEFDFGKFFDALSDITAAVGSRSATSLLRSPEFRSRADKLMTDAGSIMCGRPEITRES